MLVPRGGAVVLISCDFHCLVTASGRWLWWLVSALASSTVAAARIQLGLPRGSESVGSVRTAFLCLVCALPCRIFAQREQGLGVEAQETKQTLSRQGGGKEAVRREE